MAKVEIPERRKAKPRSYTSSDPTLHRKAMQFSGLKESFIVTKLCSYKNGKYHFIVCFPRGLNIMSYLRSFGMPLATFLTIYFLGNIYLQIHVGAVIFIALLGALITFKLCMCPPRIWKNCTGFTVLNRKHEIVEDSTQYTDFFRAYIILEEAFFRPLEYPRLPTTKGVKKKLEILDRQVEMMQMKKIPEAKTDIERELIKAHLELTHSEKMLTPIIGEQERLITEIRNLLLRISEDYIINIIRLKTLLEKIENNNTKIKSILSDRINLREKYLLLLETKYSIRIRVSTVGLYFVFLSSSFLAVLSRSVYPYALLSIEFFKYLVDLISGVRSLNRALKECDILDSKIKSFMQLTTYQFDKEKIRLSKTTG